MSTTVRTETAEYRGYELRVIEWMGTWQVSICPLRETLPFLSLTDELPSAPTPEEAFAKARWRVRSAARGQQGAGVPLLVVKSNAWYPA